jgi:hypothetical protein
LLDSGAVFAVREGEAGLEVAAVAQVFHRATILVVKIAKFF